MPKQKKLKIKIFTIFVLNTVATVGWYVKDMPLEIRILLAYNTNETLISFFFWHGSIIEFLPLAGVLHAWNDQRNRMEPLNSYSPFELLFVETESLRAVWFATDRSGTFFLSQWNRFVWQSNRLIKITAHVSRSFSQPNFFFWEIYIGYKLENKHIWNSKKNKNNFRWLF